MKLCELSRHCNVSEARLHSLAARCSLGTPAEGGRELTDGEACALGVALFLSDAGLSDAELSAYFTADDDTRRCILRRLRAALLEKAHAAQRRIDKVDCLLARLGKNEREIKETGGNKQWNM